MILTNALDLPAPLVRAIALDDYVRGDADLTVTELISPPRQVELLRQHGATIEVDAADRIFLLLGKSIHQILERAGTESQDVLFEQRLAMPMAGWTVSGQLDHFQLAPTGLLTDWKVTSTWAILDGIKDEHEAQLNCYAHLLRHHGYTVNAVQVVAILRDWSKPKAAREADYPQQQVVKLPGTLWSPQETHGFMEVSVGLHQEARSRLPQCTADERWERPTKYALMKPGAKRALKLYECEADARAAVKPGLIVEERPGEAVRCEHYCLARSVCTQVTGNSGEGFSCRG